MNWTDWTDHTWRTLSKHNHFECISFARNERQPCTASRFPISFDSCFQMWSNWVCALVPSCTALTFVIFDEVVEIWHSHHNMCLAAFHLAHMLLPALISRTKWMYCSSFAICLGSVARTCHDNIYQYCRTRRRRLVVVNHGRQSESADGPKGGWSCVFWSGCNDRSGHLTTTAGCSVV